MADLKKHLKKDANHASRMETTIIFQKFQRRIVDDAKKQNEVDVETEKFSEIDEWERGTLIGRENAKKNIACYLNSEGKEVLGLQEKN